MIGLLQTIVDLFVCWVETAVVTVLNLVFVALGALVAAVVAAIPVDMPDLPTPPSEITTTAHWVAWFFPVHQLVLVLAFVITAWLAWQLVAIALRWAKAI